MVPRAMVVLLAVGVAGHAASGAMARDAGPEAVELPLEWFAGPARPAGGLWQGGAIGATTYSYVRSRRQAFLLDRLPARPPEAAAKPVMGAAEQTYTVVERVRRERRQPLANAAFLFVSAACGIGGLAWWRCSGRGSA